MLTVAMVIQLVTAPCFLLWHAAALRPAREKASTNG
jgi:hypothetical protein